MADYFSMKDAEWVLKDMATRRFWIIDSSQDNTELLQKTLDVLYNKEFKNYEAKVTHKQSGSRLTVQCNGCNVVLSSYDPFISHNNGKSHIKAVKQVQSQDCLSMQNLLGPVVFKELKDVENNFDSDSLEYKLATTTHIVLGWQFVYREIIRDESYYTCQLCLRKTNYAIRMKINEAFKHLVSDGHLLEYMWVKFRQKGSYTSLFDSMVDIQKMEGKMMCKITTVNDRLDSDMEISSASTGNELESPSGSSDIGASSHTACVRSLSPARSINSSKFLNGKEDAGCQTVPPAQTAGEFMQEITKHYDHIAKKGDYLTDELKDDLEAQDLLIQVIKVLAQKLYIYGAEHEKDIENYAKSLLKKTNNLRLRIRK